MKTGDIKNRISAIKTGASLCNAAVFVFLLGISCVLPLIMHNGYFDITQTKTVCFFTVSAVCFILYAVSSFTASRKAGGAAIKEKAKPLNTDIAFAAFLLCYIISTVFSEYKLPALLGENGRYQGVICILAYFVTYFAVSRGFKKSKFILYAAAAVFSVVCVLAVINACGADPLGVYKKLSETDSHRFISTVGNINFYSSYICLVFPGVIYGFCVCKSKKETVFFAAAVLFGTGGAIFTASESFVIGIFAAFSVMPLFLFKNAKAFRRFLILCAGLLTAAAVIVPLACGEWCRFEISALLKSLTGKTCVGVFLIIAAVQYFAVNKKEAVPAFFKKTYCAALAAAAGAVLLAFVAANTVLKNSDPGVLTDYLKITPSWGTNRGRTWIFCLEEFKNYGLKNKLFGLGPESLAKLTAKAGFYETKQLDQAHNEFLHYLMTVGIAGLGAYAALIICTVKNVVKELKAEPLAEALLICCISYWAQSFFNIAQPFTTPLMFCYIACTAGLYKLKKEKTH